MIEEVRGISQNQNKYKVLIVSGAPFLRAGNQSFKRTVDGLISRGLEVDLWLVGNYDNMPILQLSDGDKFKIKIFSLKFMHIFSKILDNIKLKLIQKVNRKDLKILLGIYVNNNLKYAPQKVVEFRNDSNQWFKGILSLLIYGLQILLYTFYNYENLKKNIDIIWGYERTGVIIGYTISKILRKPLISSFQGTVLYYYLTKYGKLNTFLKLPIDFIALRLKSDLKIMTNDGTRGDKVIRILGDNKTPVLHVPNGIDYNILVKKIYGSHRLNKAFLGLRDNEILAITAYRLDRWKRVDRSIYLLSSLLKVGLSNIHLYIIGDGPEKLYLQGLAESLGVVENVKFLGAINYEETLDYIMISDVIFSFCDHSNLTNTVQDALFLNKWIFVLDDGSIDELGSYFDLTRVIKISRDKFIVEGIDKFSNWLDEYKRDNKLSNCELRKFWTWDNRMDLIWDTIYRKIINKILLD